MEHNFLDNDKTKPLKYHSIKCGCASCQAKSSSKKEVLKTFTSKPKGSSKNLDYRDLVWDYQILSDNLGSKETAEFSLYTPQPGSSQTYNHRGHELSVMKHSVEQTQFIKSVFDTLDRLIDLDFVQVGGGQTGDIRIYRANSNSNWGSRFNDPDTVGGGTMYGQRAGIDLEWRDMYSYDAFNVHEKSTIVHEIGHALGLQHPGDDGNNPNWDEWDSIMSYNDRSGINDDPIWFSDLDIQALQSLWGQESNQNIDLDEHLLGHFEDDVIHAFDGDDRVDAGAGDDLIYGNQGQDTLLAGDGDDLVYGGKNADQIYGNENNDHLYGNKGDDLIYGGKSNDILHGGQGNDVLYGNLGADVFHLSAGSDHVMDFAANEGDVIAIRSGLHYQVQAQGTNLLINSEIGSILLIGLEPSSFNSTQSIVLG